LTYTVTAKSGQIQENGVVARLLSVHNNPISC